MLHLNRKETQSYTQGTLRVLIDHRVQFLFVY